jgi:hypothetical protein
MICKYPAQIILALQKTTKPKQKKQKEGNRGPERSNILPKITQSESGRAEFQSPFQSLGSKNSLTMLPSSGNNEKLVVGVHRLSLAPSPFPLGQIWSF